MRGCDLFLGGPCDWKELPIYIRLFDEVSGSKYPLTGSQQKESSRWSVERGEFFDLISYCGSQEMK
jgi:hypothetical protein